MFTRILIANRGEIACRVIDTARRMGIATVAVHSDADAGARHVAMADEAVRIGPAPVADSYLRGDAIVEAALASGAQAIHPGYGFLSENPEFVEAVEAAGLVFIGPSAAAMRAMGLKDAAKDLMEKAGVPVVPGYRGDAQDVPTLAQAAEEAGYPVLIKAVAGGGGKGMRRVDDAADFAEALASAQAEARTAFGNAHVLIEKFVDSPRHIEVQVFGDGTRALHFFERDCSLQRRHQKVIEEAPAPGMTEEMRAAMGAAAVRAAEAIGYSGAGTVEFIVDGSGPLRPDGFWFMEMNTRLQVEHPVTEAITGVDLVEWQLRVAAGEGLPCAQEDLSIIGHAMEARLYAEDVPAGFLPATGTLAHLSFPEGARIDTGVRAGDAITPWYDPMIAKVTCHGADRDGARLRLLRALEGLEIAGCTTNLGFLQRLLSDEDFASGDVDTGLIARRGDALTGAVEPDAERLGWAGIVAAGLDGEAAEHAGFTLWSPLRRRIELAPGTVSLEVRGPDEIAAKTLDQSMLYRRGGGSWQTDGRRMPRAVRHGGAVTLFGADPVTIPVIDPLDRASAGAGGDAALAPMPGLVTAIAVAEGDAVEEGQRLVTLEAMKMEHVLRAPRAGKVASVAVAVGAQVDAGATLVALEPED